MILTPAPMQKPASEKVTMPALRRTVLAPARGTHTRPVLQTARVPQQLCLDLQPRLR
jgi:hypothetical protein